ncbi:hypothetical protein EON66_02655 [archaeon]|nr:MAG: hypothetical protein EON66_02655 [archaeon]
MPPQILVPHTSLFPPTSFFFERARAAPQILEVSLVLITALQREWRVPSPWLKLHPLIHPL